MKNILVIGGAGYVGTHFVDKLIEKNYKVTVYDLFIYGNFFFKNKNLNLINGDIRNLQKLKTVINHNFDCVVHLACISNDPSFELNPDLGKSINFDSFEPLVKLSKDSGADVAKDTTVNPTKIFGKPSDVAKLAAASERQSPALINAIIPTAMQMIRNMRCNKSLRSPKIEARISRMFCMMKKAETLHG